MAACSPPAGNDAVARFWDLTSGERVGQVVGGTFAIPSIAFLPDGKSLAIVNGNLIRLREVGSERITGTFQADDPLYSVAISPDGQTLAVGDSANQVLVWEIPRPTAPVRKGILIQSYWPSY
jgi:WD40 repeat protein